MAKRKSPRKTAKATPETNVGLACPLNIGPPDPRVARWGLPVILGIYALLALTAAFTVPHDPTPDPRLTPPDESAHWLFVQDLAQHHALPVFTSGGGNYEAHQPPLYYLTCVWAHWLGGLVAARVWSVVIGGLALWAAWLLAPFLVGPDPWLRLATVGALALLPSRVFVAGSVNNDGMAELWCALSLWALLRGVTAGLTPRLAALAGLFVGLGLLTKTSLVVLLPVAALALLLEPGWRRDGWRRLVLNALVGLAVIAVVWGWWVARNMSLYGEPLATGIFQRVFLKDRATPELFLSRGASWGQYWYLVASQSWMSLWGVFGQATVYMARPFYSLGATLALLAALGHVLGGLGPHRPAKDGPSRAVWLVAGALLLLTLASFLRFNSIFYQAQARYLLPAGVVAAALLAGGFAKLDRHRGAAGVTIVLLAALAGMSVWALVAHATGGTSFTPPGGH
jgi:4-amino-4-deoxy-L-arabinose transferase-like glycosyltransferase